VGRSWGEAGAKLGRECRYNQTNDCRGQPIVTINLVVGIIVFSRM